MNMRQIVSRYSLAFSALGAEIKIMRDSHVESGAKVGSPPPRA